MNKSLVALKRLAVTVEVAILLVLQQNRQRCTVRQDFESPLYISDQLRLEKKTSFKLSQDTSSEEELGG